MPRPALLDVNVLVALAWDSHVHHVAVRRWFTEQGLSAWATCPITESGFVRVSSNPKVLPAAIGVEEAIAVMRALRAVGKHRFIADDVSMTDDDITTPPGHRQVTDVHLLTLARRGGVTLVTCDRALAKLGSDADVLLLGI